MRRMKHAKGWSTGAICDTLWKRKDRCMQRIVVKNGVMGGRKLMRVNQGRDQKGHRGRREGRAAMTRESIRERARRYLMVIKAFCRVKFWGGGEHPTSGLTSGTHRISSEKNGVGRDDKLWTRDVSRNGNGKFDEDGTRKSV